MSSLGSGAGTALSPALLTCAGVATLVATLISFCSIYLHLKNYRKNVLQRMVIRIMIMIPVYGISSFVSLLSLQAAFFIDAVRDVYEAFVIYVFFQLLIAYLGGERSLLILLHGRPPVHPLFPVNLFKRDFDASDPYTYLWLKRGILQYVQVKPILAAATIISKALGKFDEGDLKAGSGYLYISIIYNVSIAVSLYCLAMFWIVVNVDLQPFRPVPKFLCVKGILFFSFWQSFFISILVAAGAVRSLGPYTDASNISIATTDLLICLEMPLFAIAHMYAFSHTDYVDPKLQYCARMPLRYALRDAFGLKDVIEDSKATLRGEGMDYRAFEPAEGKIHQGSGRDRRIRAGLRYTRGGKHKYWLPMPISDTTVEGGAKRDGLGPVDRVRNRATRDNYGAYTPLLKNQASDAVHIIPDLRNDPGSDDDEYDSDRFSLTYSDPHASDDEMYAHSRGYLFGDYNYPCIDVSSETAHRSMWEEEERILRDERGAFFSTLGPRLGEERKNYGATRPSVSKGESSTSLQHKMFKGKYVERTFQHSIAQPDVLAEQFRGTAVIDRESDRIPDLEVDGVKMQWTKSGKLVPKHRGLECPSPRSDEPDEGYVAFPPDSGSPRSRPSSSSRHSGKSSSPHRAVLLLPHDAVDLVIEDKEAWEERITRERRKGEPAVTPQSGDVKTLRKVYMHEYTAEDKKGEEGDVEANEEKDLVDQTTKENRGHSIKPSVNVALEREDVVKEDGDLMENSKSTGVLDTVKRPTTPPLHAMVDMANSRVLLDEENPWLR